MAPSRTTPSGPARGQPRRRTKARLHRRSPSSRPGARTGGATAGSAGWPRRSRHRRWFALLAASYFLEGAGYIVAGTFLVAAISATGPSWLPGSVWTIVGLAAVPSGAVWALLSRHVSRPTLLTTALILQAVGIALPAMTPAVPAALASAVLFGGTFVGITTLSLATGRHLQVPHAVAVLTAGYGIGQVLGPLVVIPTLHGGYRTALLVGAALVLAAAATSALLRIRFPHHGEAHNRNTNTHTHANRNTAPAPALRAKTTT
jgi:MFS family permease